MKEQLFFCETCEGSALIQITKNNVRVTPCQCQFEEDN